MSIERRGWQHAGIRQEFYGDSELQQLFMLNHGMRRTEH